MVRGLERRAILRDDRDRADFLRRLAALTAGGALTVYAWALLPNHAHLLVRTGDRPLSRSMRSLLTGYAGAFNRRYRRTGHLFQNRYKSIVVQEEPYFLELVRYLHLNPLRAGVVPDLRALDRYPWTGHSALLGRVRRPWQAVAAILERFHRTAGEARRRYRAFVAEGVAQGRRPELQGGGLRRSLGGWAAVAALRRGWEAFRGDERVLGEPAFVEAVRREAEAAQATSAGHPHLTAAALIARVCGAVGVSPEALRGGGRRPALSQARQGTAYLWVERLGRPGRPLAPLLGIRPAALYQAARRGRAAAARWDRLVQK